MQSYLDMLRRVRTEGVRRQNRTGIDTDALFVHLWQHDLGTGFPLLTTKRMHIHSILHELLWFIRGDQDISYLQANNVRIWNEWARPDGSVGPLYGKQWRDFGGVDQLQGVIDAIKKDPGSRRHVVSAWNAGELSQMALAPCHILYQFFVTSDGRLSTFVFQRSADCFLGVPFDIASYAFLTHMVARLTGLEVGELSFVFGDTHLYVNHEEQVTEQLSRTPRRLPRLRISNREIACIDDFRFSDFELLDYDPHPAIKGQVAV